MQEVSEKIIKEASNIFAEIGEHDNNFTKILKVGEEYKARGLTPVYILHDNMQLEIVIKETSDRKKLH
jgi:hypothetical protein